MDARTNPQGNDLGHDPVADEQSEAFARLRAIFETAVDGIVTIDAHGMIESFNPAAERLFGFQASEVRGRNVSCLMPEPYRSGHDQYVQRYIKTKEPRIIGIGREVVGRRKDGSEFPADLSVAEMTINGQLMFTGVIRDISERKNMEALMLHVSKSAALGEMVRGIAHELSQPLNIIRMAVDALAERAREGDCPPDVVASKAERVDAQVERASKLIAQMRAYASNHLEENVPFDARQAVEDAMVFVREQFRSRDIEIERDISSEPAIVLGSPNALEEIILHLLANSRDAISGEFGDRERQWGGRVLVRVGVEADEIEISVEDNGGGFPEELAGTLFDPLVSTKTARQGVGMGLSMAQGTVRTMNGWLSAENAGDGARFTVHLPRASDEDEAVNAIERQV